MQPSRRSPPADHVLLYVGTHARHKGTARLVAAFARAWWQAVSKPDGKPGRLLLLCIGQDMLELAAVVQEQWEAIQQAAAAAGPQLLKPLQQGGGLPAAVHLMENVGNATERLGWYTAGDVQVLNAGGGCHGRVGGAAGGERPCVALHS